MNIEDITPVFLWKNGINPEDKERDRQMEVLGLKVIRVKDIDVRRDPDRVTDWLMEQFRELSQSEF